LKEVKDGQENIGGKEKEAGKVEETARD